MDAAARLGDDEPHAVEVVAVLLGVVGGQDGARCRGEVEEARNCERKKAQHYLRVSVYRVR